MAAKDTFDAEPGAFENTVFEHRFHHVLATGRCESAGRRGKRRNASPVEIDRQEEEFSDENLPFWMLGVGCLIYFSAIFLMALHIAFSMV